MASLPQQGSKPFSLGIRIPEILIFFSASNSLSTVGNFALAGTGTFGRNAFISGSGTSYFNGGNVGIGITNPTYITQINATTNGKGALVVTG